MNHENDTLRKFVEVIEGTLITPPFTQTFDSFEKCENWPICEQVVCDLSEGWINPENMVVDDIDWRTYEGSTPTGNTGPSGDHTSGDGRYLYLEPSVACFNQEAFLVSPCIDLTEAVNPVLNFWYNAYGDAIGRLHLDVLSNGETISNVMTPVIGDQGPEWQEVYVDLSEFNGEVISVRFRGYTANAAKGDLALDDVSVFEIVGVDPESIKDDLRLMVYPNPGNGVFNVVISNHDSDNLQIVVTDVLGNVVYSEKSSFSGNIFKDQIDLSGVSKGVYFISVTLVGSETLLGSAVQKLVIN